MGRLAHLFDGWALTAEWRVLELESVSIIDKRLQTFGMHLVGEPRVINRFPALVCLTFIDYLAAIGADVILAGLDGFCAAGEAHSVHLVFVGRLHQGGMHQAVSHAVMLHLSASRECEWLAHDSSLL